MSFVFKDIRYLGICNPDTSRLDKDGFVLLISWKYSYATETTTVINGQKQMDFMEVHGWM